MAAGFLLLLGSTVFLLLLLATTRVLGRWIDDRIDPRPAFDPDGHCRRCGYRLRGIAPDTTACPECGADLNAHGAREHYEPVSNARQWLTILFGLGVVATLLAAVVVWTFIIGAWLMQGAVNP